MVGVALAFMRIFRFALLAAAAATGLFVGAAEVDRQSAERRAFRDHDNERFVRTRVPLDRDWSDRGHYHALRSSRFEIDGRMFITPLTLYARFEPPLIQLEESAIVEGRLRYDERGRYTMSIKSPRLLNYDGAMNMLWPAAWNRAIANRLRRHAPDHPHEIAMIEALVLGRG